MTDTPVLNGQILGQAAAATRALFDDFLAEVGTDFLSWLALNQLDADGHAAIEDDLVRGIAGAVRTEEGPVPPSPPASATGPTASRSGSTVPCPRRTWPPPAGS
jgi:hypothetical protein